MNSGRQIRKTNAAARRLPPLNGLRAFEAAARHLSFKHAAEELSVTPAAISQQVRALEEICGRPLFHRRTRSLALTETGLAALPGLSEGFDRIAAAAERMVAAPGSGLLTVSVAPAFGAKWLLPRLGRFRQACPDIDIRIDANNAPADFLTDGVDVAIRYGPGVYPGLVSDCIHEAVEFPVCSPALMTSGPPLETPFDLANHNLLHIDQPHTGATVPTWEMWLEAAGAGAVDSSRGLRFTAETMAIQAAIDGVGVVLSVGAVVADDLAAGRLVRAFPNLDERKASFCYYVVRPPRADRDPNVRAFRDWVLAEALEAGLTGAL